MTDNKQEPLFQPPSRNTQETFALRMKYMDASKALLGDIVMIYGRMATHGEIEPALFHAFLFHVQNLRDQLQKAELDIVKAFYTQEYTAQLPAVPPHVPGWHEQQITQPIPRVRPQRQVTQPLSTTGAIPAQVPIDEQATRKVGPLPLRLKAFFRED